MCAHIARRSTQRPTPLSTAGRSIRRTPIRPVYASATPLMEYAAGFRLDRWRMLLKLEGNDADPLYVRNAELRADYGKYPGKTEGRPSGLPTMIRLPHTKRGTPDKNHTPRNRTGRQWARSLIRKPTRAFNQGARTPMRPVEPGPLEGRLPPGGPGGSRAGRTSPPQTGQAEAERGQG